MVQLASGDLIDARFEVQFCAGVGGMGRVYRCHDTVSGQPVALKVMDIITKANRERFAREVRVLSELRHPGIVRYVAHGALSDQEPYLVMEWVEGQALGGRIRTEPLAVREAVALTRRLCDALGEAHARGIIHRDIKPANIILQDGKLSTPKVLDFGLARSVDATHAITRTGGLVGTPAYMAPEQARRTSELTARADVFALGCVLFECLAGYAAFRGPSVVSVLCKVLLEDPPWLSDLRSDVPGSLSQLVARMLYKDPGERPQDAREVLETLDTMDIEEPSPVTQRPSIGSEEQRYLSVILAGRPQSPTPEPPTAASTPRLLVGMRKAVELYEAEVHHLIDSTVMLTLKGSGTAADRAARAGRCALSVRDLLPHVPVVLATGRGLVRVKQPIGEVIDEAARLLQVATTAAPSEDDGGPVLVDSVTASLLDARFDLRERAEQVELLAYRAHSLEPRKLLGRKTPCVGRARELATLRAVWEECAEGVARPVVITGPSGIGKTRLLREWMSELNASDQPPRVLSVRADPMGAGGAFGMLGRLLRSAAQARDEDPHELVRSKVRALVESTLAPEEVERVAGLLAEMAGAPSCHGEDVAERAARHDPVLRGDQIRRAFQDWLLAETRRQPTLIVLEDMQWGDLPTVELLGTVLRHLHEQPLCVVGVARPELEERFPRLWEARDVTSFGLGPLRFRAAVQLVCAALSGIDDARAESIAKRSGGNPFFIEELIRAEAEGRSQRAPDNVLAMLQARLDELSPSLRMVLRAASVYGESFSAEGVAALLGEEQDAVLHSLDALMAREVLVKLNDAEDERSGDFAFAQGLWREASYATLTPKDLRLGHALAAAHLELRRPDEALAIAEHFEQGEELERALHWFVKASHQALQGGDYAAVLARAERGLKCVAQGSTEHDKQRGELHYLKAEAHKWRGENQLAEQRASSALNLLSSGSASWFAALGEAAAASGKLGNKARLVQLAELLLAAPGQPEAALPRVMALARTATQLSLAGRTDTADALLGLLASQDVDASVAGWVYEARAVRAGSGGDPGARVSLAQEAARAFERVQDLRNACLQHTSVGFALNEIGAYAMAREALESAIALGERMELSNATSTAEAQLGRALSRLGQHERAEATLRAAISSLRAQGNSRLEGVARSYLARLMHDTGRAAAAEEEARRAVQVLEHVAPLKAGALAVLALSLLALERGSEACAAAEEAHQLLERLGGLSTSEGLVRWMRAETLLRAGQSDLAAHAIAVATQQLRARASQLRDPVLKSAFDGMTEHARTYQLAETAG